MRGHFYGRMETSGEDGDGHIGLLLLAILCTNVLKHARFIGVVGYLISCLI